MATYGSIDISNLQICFPRRLIVIDFTSYLHTRLADTLRLRGHYFSLVFEISRFQTSNRIAAILKFMTLTLLTRHMPR